MAVGDVVDVPAGGEDNLVASLRQVVDIVSPAAHLVGRKRHVLPYLHYARVGHLRREKEKWTKQFKFPEAKFSFKNAITFNRVTYLLTKLTKKEKKIR